MNFGFLSPIAAMGLSLFLTMLVASGSARAERTVLAPNGDTLSPGAFRTEFAIDPEHRNQNRVWLQYSTPQGIELETERLDLVGERKKGYSFNIQYPITISLTNAIPAVTVGVRDLTCTAGERSAFYIAATKTVSLSDRQAKYLRDFKLDLGAGTGRIGGLFAGVQIKLASGLSLKADVYKRRPNVSIALPISHYLEARAYTLDNHFFYGLAFSLQR